MRVAALVHFATPYRNAGSESVLHLFLKALVEDGNEVICYITDVGLKPAMVYEGVELVPIRNVTVGIQRLRVWAPDVVISHHQNATMVNKFCRRWDVKSIYLTHNDMNVNELPLRAKPSLVVHNSDWVQKSLERYPFEGHQMVVHPPLDCSRHRVNRTGDALTLINVNEHKGGKILIGLAKRMPDLQFQAVIGGHGLQVRMPNLPNLSTIRHNPDLKPVWRSTRLLLMPSIYESYGLVGIEAGCSGIPTLANDTPGLRESLGKAGLFVSERLNLDEWEAAIRQVLDEDYDAASKAALANSELKCEQTSEDLIRFVHEVKLLTST